MAKWEKIKGIYELDGLGMTPASSRISTGEIFINPEKFWKLSPDERLFILLHEAGHIILDTKDELKVDAWAHEEYTKLDGSLKHSISAFEGMDISERQIQQMKRALHYDAHQNGNMDALSQLFNIQQKDIQSGPYMAANLSEAHINAGDQELSNFWGLIATGVASLIGGIFGSKSKKDATRAAAEAAENELEAQKDLARLNYETQVLQARYSLLQTKNSIKILIVLGVLGVVGYSVYIILKRKKAA